MKDSYIEKLESLLIGVENFRFDDADVADVGEWKELTTNILKGAIAREKANQEADKLANSIWSKLEGHYNPSYAEVEENENEKDVEVVEFPEGTTDKEIQQEFENFVWEKIGDDFYWNKTKLETRKEENNE